MGDNILKLDENSLQNPGETMKKKNTVSKEYWLSSLCLSHHCHHPSHPHHQMPPEAAFMDGCIQVLCFTLLESEPTTTTTKWWPGHIVSNASGYQSNGLGYQSWPRNAAAVSTICFPIIWMMKEWWCSVLSNLLPNPAQWQTKQLVTTKTDSSLIAFSQWIHHALHYLSDR